MLLNGVAGGGGSRGDAELAVNGGQVPVDGAWTDDELLGYLGIGEPLGHQAQYLDLAGRQSCWIGRMTCRSGCGGPRRFLDFLGCLRGLWREGLMRGERLLLQGVIAGFPQAKCLGDHPLDVGRIADRGERHEAGPIGKVIL